MCSWNCLHKDVHVYITGYVFFHKRKELFQADQGHGVYVNKYTMSSFFYIDLEGNPCWDYPDYDPVVMIMFR